MKSAGADFIQRPFGAVTPPKQSISIAVIGDFEPNCKIQQLLLRIFAIPPILPLVTH
jgi:hypothetical protein